MNIELLQRVKAHILEEPKRLDMSDWLYKIDPNADNAPACGTTGCIAGWTCQLCGRKVDVDFSSQYFTIAAGLLGLDEQQASALFFQTSWPQEFYVRLREAPYGSKPAAEITAQRIDHFIQTKGRE